MRWPSRRGRHSHDRLELAERTIAGPVSVFITALPLRAQGAEHRLARLRPDQRACRSCPPRSPASYHFRPASLIRRRTLRGGGPGSGEAVAFTLKLDSFVNIVSGQCSDYHPEQARAPGGRRRWHRCSGATLSGGRRRLGGFTGHAPWPLRRRATDRERWHGHRRCGPRHRAPAHGRDQGLGRRLGRGAVAFHARGDAGAARSTLIFARCTTLDRRTGSSIWCSSIRRRALESSAAAAPRDRDGAQLADALTPPQQAHHPPGSKTVDVLLTKSGAKVLDFGMARINCDDMLTHPGARVGTPGTWHPNSSRGSPPTHSPTSTRLAVR